MLEFEPTSVRRFYAIICGWNCRQLEDPTQLCCFLHVEFHTPARLFPSGAGGAGSAEHGRLQRVEERGVHDSKWVQSAQQETENELEGRRVSFQDDTQF